MSQSAQPRSARNTYRFSLIALTASSLLVGAAATAQTDSDVTLLPEVIVTASAIPLAADQVGSSVSVITSDEIEQRQISRVTDALRLLPGVNITTTGPNGSGSVFVRGHSSSDVLVLVDGVRMNDPSTSGNGIDISLLSMNNVERIEFIKGAQSAVWGSNAVAGVINIITKTAEEEGVTFNTFAEVGSRDFYRGGGGLTAKSDNNSLILNFSGKKFGGISAADGGAEDDAFDERAVSLRFQSQLTDQWDVNLGVRRQNSTTEYDSPPVDNGNFSDADIQSFDFSSTYQVNDFTNKIYTNTNKTDRFNHSEGLFGSDTDFVGRTRTIGYQGSYQFGAAKNNALSLKVEEINESVQSTSFFAPTSADEDTQEYALELNLAPTENTDIAAAVRYQDSDIFGSDTTYRLSASQKVGNAGRAHASYGTSVRNPSLNELYSPTGGNLDLIPQESDSFDIGFEQSFMDGQFIVDATYFYSEVDNLFGFDNSTFQSINILGETKRQGVEISARGDITDNTSFNASYTYLDAETVDGSQEIRRPENSLDFGLTHKITPRWTVGGDMQLRTGNIDTDFSTFPSAQVDLDDYALFNLRTAYQLNDQVEIYGRVENVTDEDYQQVLGYGTLGTSAYIGVKGNF